MSENKCCRSVLRAILPMKRQCDPNGIRTRVTAVKGRCPGPLDDRVTQREQYQNCYSWTQGKLPSLFRALSRQTGHSSATTAPNEVRESTPLREHLHRDACSKRRARFAKGAGAHRCRAEARRLSFQGNRHREPGSRLSSGRVLSQVSRSFPCAVQTRL